MRWLEWTCTDIHDTHQLTVTLCQSADPSLGRSYLFKKLFCILSPYKEPSVAGKCIPFDTNGYVSI